MSQNIFFIEYQKAKQSFSEQRVLNLIVKIISLGLFNIDKKVKMRQEILLKCEEALLKYNLLCEKENILKSESVVTELSNVRIGKKTLSLFKVIGGEDYGKNWETIRTSVLERDNYQCQESDGYCTAVLHVHHILPLTKGGTNEFNNLITLCLYHHSLKHEHMKRNL